MGNPDSSGNGRFEGWNRRNAYYLAVMTTAYIVGEIAHFLINTSSRSVARDVHYGDSACYAKANVSSSSSDVDCRAIKEEAACVAESAACEWNYSGLGLEYQLLAGPSFIAVFTVTGLVVGFASDALRRYVSRTFLMSVGVLLFSTSCFLMGTATQFWQLVLLRMGIAAGRRMSDTRTDSQK